MWAIGIYGMAVGIKLYSYLRRNISEANLFEYWVHKKNQISEEEIQNIEWDAQGMVMQLNSHTH